MNGGIDAFGKQLVCQSIALAVASDDATDFPEAEVVEEFTGGCTEIGRASCRERV